MSVFVVMEGTDGSGTTTQGNLLATALRSRGVEVLRTREPSDGPIGVLIRQGLRGEWMHRPGAEQVALLFAADRVDHCQVEIGPALAAGHAVICDRYLGSSLAFQVVDGAGGFDAAWLLDANRFARVPDLTIWLDVPVDLALERIDARGIPRERFEVEDTLRAVRERYEAMWRSPPPRLGPVVRIDGSGTIDDVHARVVAALADRWPAMPPPTRPT